jgi:N6-adenosine-specific RNA methylase IME4
VSTPSTALVVPDPRRAPVPDGWWQRDVLPLVRTCESWKQLDGYEARLAAMAAAIERLGGDVVEFEKALRVVECRRGELLGDHGKGRPARNSPRMGNLKVKSQTASRYRTIARHWRVIYSHLLKETDRRKVTQSHVLHLVHKRMNRAKVDAITAQTVAPRFTTLYDVVVIDPPWPTDDIERDVRPAQAGFDYPRMTEEQLREFRLPMRADCHTWLWTTHRFLPMAFRLLEAWELTYHCTFVWHKPGGYQPVHLPQYNCEFALYARRGTPTFTTTKNLKVCFEAPRRGHSEKPEAFYDLVRRVTPEKRIDIFNRREIEGFDAWGNEAAP